MDQQKGYELYRRIIKIGLPVMIVLFLLSFGMLAFSYATTGEFFERDISLAGGVTLSFSTDDIVDSGALERTIQADIQESVRVRTTVGERTEVVLESRVQDQDRIDAIVYYVSSEFGVARDSIAINFIGETLGASFFRETLSALIGAFVLMGISVLLIFRKWIAASYVIFAALADIVMTIATVNLIGMEVSTGGLAAFLMLLGYSVDTDILLTTKMLKKQKEPIEDRFHEAFWTGLTMSGTSFLAVTIGAIVSNSPLIREIMIIIAIGLVWDVLNTWLVNGALVMRKLDAEVAR